MQDYLLWNIVIITFLYKETKKMSTSFNAEWMSKEQYKTWLIPIKKQTTLKQKSTLYEIVIFQYGTKSSEKSCPWEEEH